MKGTKKRSVRRRPEPCRIRWKTCPLTSRIPPDTLENLPVDVPNPAGYVGKPAR